MNLADPIVTPDLEQRANANLIAAAPELFEALHSLRNEVHGALSVAEPEVREAIGNTNITAIFYRIVKAEQALAKARFGLSSSDAQKA